MPRCGNFTYEIIHKKVKHISIRVTKEGDVKVTVPHRGSVKQAEAFVESRQDWVEEKLRQMTDKIVLRVGEQVWTKQKETYLAEITARIFPRFAMYGISYPTLRFRKMISCYGTCQPGTGIITLNKILADMPLECAEYVAAHELAHLLVANHSREFYRVLSGVMPDYKQREERLAEYALYH